MSIDKLHNMFDDSAPEQPLRKRPNYFRRRVGAGALLLGTALGVAKTGEVAWNHLTDNELGCVTTTIDADDEGALPAVYEAMEDLAEIYPEFEPRHSREVNGQAERLGTVHLGEEIVVCAIDDPIMGDSILVSRPDQ